MAVLIVLEYQTKLQFQLDKQTNWLMAVLIVLEYQNKLQFQLDKQTNWLMAELLCLNIRLNCTNCTFSWVNKQTG